VTEGAVTTLVLELPGRRLVALASQVRSIGGDPDPGTPQPDEWCDLDDHLAGASACDPDVAPHWLQLQAHPARALRTRARMRLEHIRRERFFRLPPVLRRAGCSPWVRGVVVETPAAPPSNGSTGASDELAVWIDLLLLAASPSSNPGSSP